MAAALPRKTPGRGRQVSRECSLTVGPEKRELKWAVWLPTSQNPKKGKVGGKESLLYFGGQQHGGDGAVERVDSYPKADLGADNPDGFLQKYSMLALTVTLKLLMHWSDQPQLDCFQYS